MDRLLRLLVSVKESKWGEQGGATDDDGLVERLSRRYTSTLLAAFAMMVTTKQFVGEPISCWCPTYFTDGQRQYTNNNAAAHLVLVSDLLHRRTAAVHQQRLLDLEYFLRAATGAYTGKTASSVVRKDCRRRR